MPYEYRDEVEKLDDRTRCDCCLKLKSENDVTKCETCDNLACKWCLDNGICKDCQESEEK